MVDVSQHELVPEHVLIDDPDEIQAILDEYDVRKTDLPKIKRTDPATPDDAEVGDVVKIIRDSRTTDQAVVYRLVLS
ncbi:DNA-directed RNA polymerase subunit H [Halorubrum sp. SY-15]|jgi:DNA-directed RNA polymerase subunit H|uniref:DNA-directed RNA polymerase subunit H n=1 Tax=Halorubrum sp. SY-15 TaxID=3402277 RepID=UPI003EBA8C4D